MKMCLLTLAACVCGLLSCTSGEAGLSNDGEGPGFSRKPEVRISIKAEPDGLNPVLSTQSISRYVYEQIFQTLNDQDPATFELVPLLASTPVVEEGADGTMSYSYVIDSVARWPNGSPVTAYDVLFSMKVVMNPLVDSGPYRLYYKMVKDLEISSTDSLAFRVVTTGPYILAAEAIGDLYIYPEYAYDPEQLMRDIPLAALTDPATSRQLEAANQGLKTFATGFNDPATGFDPARIVGSGPYALEFWEANTKLSLRRRDDYWGSGSQADRLAARPEYLTYLIISDPGTNVNALRDMAVDVVVDLPVDVFRQLQQDPYLEERFDFVAVPGFKYFSILLNEEDPLLRDSLTRRALAHLVDVDRIIDRSLPGLARRIVGPVLPSKPYYNKELEPIPFDLKKAAELLKEAGWQDTTGDGVLDKVIDGERREFNFQLLSFNTSTSEAFTVVAAAGAREVGVNIEVIRMEGRALIKLLNDGNFTAAFNGQGVEPTPDDFSQVWLSTSVPPTGTNRVNFQSAEADLLIRQISVTTDSTSRARMYRRFQEIIYANQPMIFLYSPYDLIVVSKRFDYQVSSIAPNLEFNALRLRDST